MPYMLLKKDDYMAQIQLNQQKVEHGYDSYMLDYNGCSNIAGDYWLFFSSGHQKGKCSQHRTRLHLTKSCNSCALPAIGKDLWIMCNVYLNCRPVYSTESNISGVSVLADGTVC